MVLDFKQLPYMLLKTVYSSSNVHIFATQLSLNGGIALFSPLMKIVIYFHSRNQVFGGA
jgi:hypothetical protein